MAKQSPPKSGGLSKFRMVVIDAELQEGEIAQLTQAIQGAFGVQRAAVVRVNGVTAKALPGSEVGETLVDTDDGEVSDAVEAEVVVSSAPRQKTSKKLRTPDLVADLHPGEEPSFKAYAEARRVTSSTSVLSKFLAVAAWLHEERSGTKISADRAYTCFRFIGWPCNIDFDQPLRDMKAKSKFVETKAGYNKGECSITHLGLDRVNKMKSSQ